MPLQGPPPGLRPYIALELRASERDAAEYIITQFNRRTERSFAEAMDMLGESPERDWLLGHPAEWWGQAVQDERHSPDEFALIIGFVDASACEAFSNA